MTHPTGRAYTFEERRAIVQEAKDTALKLLEKLEVLAHMEGVHENFLEGTQANDGNANGID